MIDIRNMNLEVTRIKFADEAVGGVEIASYLDYHEPSCMVAINDGSEFVLISDKTHAEYLISAIRKAIELGWFEEE